MDRRRFISSAVKGGAALAAAGPLLDGLVFADRARLPNIILVNCDDLGYGDLGCYGSVAVKTPNIDAMARRGVRFTDFHACDSVCTPSRAGLLTGRYPSRMKLDYPLSPPNAPLGKKIAEKAAFFGNTIGLIDVGSEEGAEGIDSFEITLPEALRQRGYFTAMIGKWHLGDFSADERHNPLEHGFQTFFGVPHSNDMLPFPLYRGRDELETQITDQSKLTGLYTDEAIRIVEAKRDEPFFLYLAHTFPHRPLYRSDKFKNKSDGGLYGDVVEEIDWHFGRLMASVDKAGLLERTLIVFTSDNGPWYDGSPGAFRGRKGQSFEGGYRVPFIARWDGVTPAGKECAALSSNIDVFPTLLSLARVDLPRDRIIDGRSFREQLANPDAPAGEREIFYYHHGKLEAIRVGDWKYVRNINHYVWPMPINKPLGHLSNHTTGPLPMLFNMRTDPGENYNVAHRYPDRVKDLDARITRWEKAMAKNRRGVIGG